MVSVNLGRPQVVEGIKDPTAIDKHRVESARVGFLGVEGDEVADTRYHGGTYMAVYAFAQEDLDAGDGAADVRVLTQVLPGTSRSLKSFWSMSLIGAVVMPSDGTVPSGYSWPSDISWNRLNVEPA